MENPTNETPVEEPAREDTGFSVTTATDLTPTPSNEAKRSDEPTTIASLPPQQKPKKNIARATLIALVLLLLGAASGVVLYKLYFEPKTTASSNSSVTSQTTTSTTTTSLSAASLINALKTRMKASEVPTTTVSGGTITVTTDGKFGAFSVTYAQPSGYNFYTMPQTMAGFTVASKDSDVTSSDAMTVRAYLTEQGLSAGSVTMDDENEIISSSDFVNNDVRCKVEETSYGYTAGAYQVQVGCADVSSYNANAAILQPLYKAYVAAHPDLAQAGLFLGRADVKSSTVTGYQHVTVSSGNVFSPVGGSAALFYRTPDGTWHYFANTQDEIMCAQYTSADLKNAFAGVTCALSDGTESKVSP